MHNPAPCQNSRPARDSAHELATTLQLYGLHRFVATGGIGRVSGDRTRALGPGCGYKWHLGPCSAK